ncbi:hypothetical protein Q604_UNBC04787G0001, partial [human gut metagenome]
RVCDRGRFSRFLTLLNPLAPGGERGIAGGAWFPVKAKGFSRHRYFFGTISTGRATD